MQHGYECDMDAVNQRTETTSKMPKAILIRNLNFVFKILFYHYLFCGNIVRFFFFSSFFFLGNNFRNLINYSFVCQKSCFSTCKQATNGVNSFVRLQDVYTWTHLHQKHNSAAVLPPPPLFLYCGNFLCKYQSKQLSSCRIF